MSPENRSLWKSIAAVIFEPARPISLAQVGTVSLVASRTWPMKKLCNVSASLKGWKHTQCLVGIRISGSLWTHVRAHTSESHNCLFVVEVCSIKTAENDNALALVKLVTDRGQLLSQGWISQIERLLSDLGSGRARN